MRQEPSLGSQIIVTATNIFSGKKVSHEALVESALEAFTKAETKMDDAINQIQLQIDEEQRAIEEAQQRVEAAGKSKDKLSRVLDRFRAFTA